MKRSAADILEDALTLPVEARAEIAGHLIESLDEAVDEDSEAAWSIEIVRRIEEIDRGATQLVPWGDARRHLAGR